MARDDYWSKYWERKVSRRRILGGALAAGAGLSAMALVGCGDDDSTSTATTASGATPAGTAKASPAATQAAKKKGGRLVVGNGAMVGQFDPNTSTSAADWALLFAIYDTLMVTDDAGTVKAKLATSWETNDGQITLKLRNGVKFHDGTPFNAPAVKRNVERTLQLNSRSRIFSQWSQVSSVTAPDDSTVIFKLAQPQYGPMIANMATIAGAMPSPDAVDKLGDKFNSQPVGAGPYKVDSVALDSKVVTSAFKDYWNAAAGAPYMDGIDYKIVPQAPALVTAMQAGEVDLIHYTTFAPAAEIDQVKGVSGVQLLQKPGHSFTEERLNRGKAPFDNPDLLKAFGYALDRKAILAANHGGNGRIAGGPINPATWAWDPSFVGFAIPDSDRDAKVRDALAKGGSPNGFNFTFKFAGPSERAELMAQMVKKYGITAGIEVLPPTAGTQYLYDGDFQATPSYTPQYSPDPDSIFRPNFHSKGQFNYHRYSNADLDALLDKAAAETNQDARKQMYWDAQKLVFDSGIPRIPNVYVDILIPYYKKVQDLTVGWDTYIRVGDVWLNS